MVLLNTTFWNLLEEKSHFMQECSLNMTETTLREYNNSHLNYVQSYLQ